MAVDDDLLVKNPFDFQLATVIINDSIMREAISRSDERKFLDFVKKDGHFCQYYDGIVMLFKIGMRISEFTVDDINLKKSGNKYRSSITA